MRRVRSMLIPVRGQIRKRVARRPFREMGAWLPWIRSPDAEIDQFRDRLATHLRKQAGLETSESRFIADGHIDDEWQELLAQREREVRAFHEIGRRPVFIEGARVPAMKEGEVIRSVGAEGQSSTLSRDAGLATLRLEAELDLWGQTESRVRSDPPPSEPMRSSSARSPRRQFVHALQRLLHGGRARPRRPVREVSGFREGRGSAPARSTWPRLSSLMATVRRWGRS